MQSTHSQLVIQNHVISFPLHFLQRDRSKGGSVATFQQRTGKDGRMLLAPSVSGPFKWRQFEPEVILLAVGWYLRFSLSYRDVENFLLSADFWSTTSPSGGGSNVTPQNSAPIATAAPTDQRQLACGRDLDPG